MKPVNYGVELLIRPHPTLRPYCEHPECTEADPAYHIYPLPKPRLEVRDEIQLQNARTDEDREFKLPISKTPSGAFINQVDVPTSA